MARPSSARVAFVLSATVLAFLYGYAAHKFGWFPSGFLESAYRQGHRVVASPRPDTLLPDFLQRRRYERSGVRVPRPDEMQPGLTRITTRWKAPDDSLWKPGLKLVGPRGRVVHRWQVNPAHLFGSGEFRRGIEIRNQDIQGSHLFPDGDVLINIEYAGTVRLDACGDLEWKMSPGSHHSVHRAEDGSFWIPGLSLPRPATTRSHPDGLPGLEGPIYHGLLLHVSPQGRTLDSLDVLDVLYRNGLEDHVEPRFRHDDVVHMNDIEPLPDTLADEYPRFEAGDLLVSLRDANLVFVVDPGTGRVRWHADGPFRLQHDPDFLGDGWIGVFDNRWDGDPDPRRPGERSRIIALRPSDDSVRVLFPTPRSEPFFTAHRGKWQRLANGNLLLTEADAGRVVEVAPDGGTVWEWIAPPYADSLVPGVSNAVRHDLSPDEVRAWPCGPDEGAGEGA